MRSGGENNIGDNRPEIIRGVKAREPFIQKKLAPDNPQPQPPKDEYVAPQDVSVVKHGLWEKFWGGLGRTFDKIFSGNLFGAKHIEPDPIQIDPNFEVVRAANGG